MNVKLKEWLTENYQPGRTFALGSTYVDKLDMTFIYCDIIEDNCIIRRRICGWYCGNPAIMEFNPFDLCEWYFGDTDMNYPMGDMRLSEINITPTDTEYYSEQRRFTEDGQIILKKY